MNAGIADGGADAGDGGDRVDVLPYIYRVTKYDPADRDERVQYVGAEDISSDHARVEASHLAVVAAFAEDSTLGTPTLKPSTGTRSPPRFGLNRRNRQFVGRTAAARVIVGGPSWIPLPHQRTKRGQRGTHRTVQCS
jgi:hypothetical protein